jgi:CrcB protein
MWYEILWIALAGAVGTLARYGLGGAVQTVLGQSFPWGTLVVNAIGCLLFGLIWTLAEERLLISGHLRVIVLVGFMGAFTTFSTFAFETAQQLRDREWLIATGNVSAHLILGIGMFFLGAAVVRAL